jgi:hypothetical protein
VAWVIPRDEDTIEHRPKASNVRPGVTAVSSRWTAAGWLGAQTVAVMRKALFSGYSGESPTVVLREAGNG